MAEINLGTPTPLTASVPGFPDKAFAITASADTFSAPVTVFVGGAGSVTVTTWSGQSVTYQMPAGLMIPVRVKAVTASTATGLVGHY